MNLHLETLCFRRDFPFQRLQIFVAGTTWPSYTSSAVNGVRPAWCSQCECALCLRSTDWMEEWRHEMYEYDWICNLLILCIWICVYYYTYILYVRAYQYMHHILIIHNYIYLRILKTYCTSSKWNCQNIMLDVWRQPETGDAATRVLNNHLLWNNSISMKNMFYHLRSIQCQGATCVGNECL